ncbi:hypothetical protein PULV_b0192 [Pseudoalteromonas ulvae UL12]|uniref:DUF4397 domain-containing protein n=1 Tax=Pseudoalteromonas ulvae TaxID=107327 RepID=A0A244CQP7_PSEDV|nr:DUF4397 domain-containing protein [Pseudoalteromonas ulvae]MBE0365586.1 hypothetical protein [Pseudoalteromonas ulvae UL12]OUL57941.1 hypothetical protein B1199_06135 [Pseudoalteromonas ulvae]
MKTQALVFMTVLTLLTGCEEQTYQANVRAVNLANDELTVRWHDDNRSAKVALTKDGNALLYGHASDGFTFTNQAAQGNVFTFDSQTYLAEPVVAPTSFAFTDTESYLIFTYGDPDSLGEQKAEMGAIYLYQEDISDEKYRFNVLHTYFPMMADVDVYLNGVLIEEDLSYGDGAGFFTVSIDKTQLVVVKANYPVNSPNPLLSKTLEPDSGKLQVVFIAPKESDHAEFSAEAFIVKTP